MVPGAIALLVLLRVRRSMGDPIESRDQTAATEATAASDRPRSAFEAACPTAECLLALAAASAATTAGLVTFAVISIHLSQDHAVSVAAVPLIYAAAMAAEALAALGSGWLFDRTEAVGTGWAAASLRRYQFWHGHPLIAITGVLLWGGRRSLIPPSKRWWPSHPSLEAGHRVRRVRCCSGRSRHRRWSHGRCTVRAITPRY